MGNKHNTRPVQTTSKPDESSLLKAQISKISQEYQNLFQQALNYKEAAYQNALAANTIITQVTSDLLNLETDDTNVIKKVNEIVRKINKTQEEQVVNQPVEGQEQAIESGSK